MKKAIFFLIAIIAVDVAIQVYLTTQLTMAQRKTHELEVRIDTLIHDVADEVMNDAVGDPRGFFSLVETSEAWQPIDAVPYSLCYRHLIGTTTADFILCQAR